ncbi:hypothetical protein L596_023813 [Steinernema carpocapsae]|nr:hypothetical protein L596_023813 [Steinernema carpocapsae]
MPSGPPAKSHRGKDIRNIHSVKTLTRLKNDYAKMQEEFNRLESANKQLTEELEVLRAVNFKNVSHFSEVHKRLQNLKSDNEHITAHYSEFLDSDRKKTEMINRKINTLNRLREACRQHNVNLETDVPSRSTSRIRSFDVDCKLETCAVRQIVGNWKVASERTETEPSEETTHQPKNEELMK